MNLTEKQINEMIEAAKPLVAWLKKNAHPHVKAIVDDESIELVEALACRLIEKKDENG